MYNWRRMSDKERIETLKDRKRQKRPWHSPPHFDIEGEGYYFVTAVCYEHASIIGKSHRRMVECKESLLSICEKLKSPIFAWCILPNHYHFLVQTDCINHVRIRLGTFHGRTSRRWNLEDNMVGRKVWFNCIERLMKSDRHFWATINYIHNNPVHHGYVSKWTDWEFSSVADFIKKVSIEEVNRIWEEYPLLDYGKNWDI